jgi:tetratricopeptide (TPR) repeat protein
VKNWLAGRRERGAKPQITFRFPADPSCFPIDPDARRLFLLEPHATATHYLACGDPAAAYRTTWKLVERYPDDPSALRLHSLAALAAGRSEEGVVAARTAVELAPDDPAGPALLALQLMASGQPNAIVRPLEPSGPCLDFLVEQVNTLLTTGTHEAARAGTNLVERVAPLSPQVSVLRGDWARHEQRWADAEVAYLQALERAPDTRAYLERLGDVLVPQRRYRDAWRHWNQAVRVAPEAAGPNERLEAALSRVTGYSAGALALLAGLAGMIPTLRGETPNYWMPGITLAGPLLIGLDLVPIRRLTHLFIAPALAAQGKLAKRPSEAPLAGFLSALVLIVLHAAQAWLEIALHLELFGARWIGAGTVTLLAAGACIWMVRRFKASHPRPDPA